MGTADLLIEIHTTVMGWEKNGFPNCSRQDQRILELEKKVDWYRKVVWALAIGTGLGAALGGCI